MTVTRADIEAQWTTVRDAIKRKWPAIGDEELREARGSAGHLIGLIQQRTSEPRDEIEAYLERLVGPGGWSRFAETLRAYVPELRVAESCRETVERHPVGITAASFGVGLAVGFVLAEVISESFRPARRSPAQELGHRLYQSLSGIVPGALRDSLKLS